MPWVFAATFVALGVGSYTRTSATWDEPIHLMAGYAIVAHGDFRVDPSHPPLLRMWAAAPLLLMDGIADPPTADAAAPAEWLAAAYLGAHDFLYVRNDADRLLYTSRFMVLLLGVLLGLLLFAWAREWMGGRTAVVALAAYTLEPNVLAHSTLVTTDLGVTCLGFGALYLCWRATRRPSWSNLTALTAITALVVAAKFSGILVVGIVVGILAVAAWRDPSLPPRRAIATIAAIGAASVLVIWASYGFRYLPSHSPVWVFDLHTSNLAASAPTLAAIVELVDRYHLLPNAFTQGLLYSGASLARMPAFLAGAGSFDGWWFYFPVAFLIKTPLVVLALIGVGLAVPFRRSSGLHGRDLACVLVPAGAILAVAAATGINLGVRHILPIYPLLILLGAAGVVTAARRAPRTIGTVAAAAGMAAALELASVYPFTLTFFNQFIGGPGAGHLYLADSNLGWGHGLKALKAWMNDAGVTHVNLAYFGQADPAYYQIDCTHLPGAPAFAIDAVSRPRLPGYVAVSATTLNGVYAPASWQLFYAPLRSMEPRIRVANSIHVFWLDAWPQTVGASAVAVAPEAHRELADALLQGLEWPQQALAHYEEYLRARPGDPAASISYSRALSSVGRSNDALAALQRAADANGADGSVRLWLARLLLSRGDLPGAEPHAGEAVRLLPDDVDAHTLLGRVRAAQGRFLDAVDAFERALALAPGHREAGALLRRARAASASTARRNASGDAH